MSDISLEVHDPEPSSSSTVLTVLLFSDIVGSTSLKSRLGTVTYAKMLSRHNELFEEGVRRHNGEKGLKHTGDGYFATFPTSSDAVRFALHFQGQMVAESWEPEPLTTRIGIHMGEVALMNMAGRDDFIGYSADIASRVMSLAQGNQILMTAQIFNDARQFVDRFLMPTGNASPLRWIAHGQYLFRGSDEPLDVFEVGAEGCSPLTRPKDSDKAKRVVSVDQESTLGWRPAIGLAIPARSGWVFEKKIGDGGFGEVWLGQQGILKQRRVFKFCFDTKKLNSFKRELTLFRLLREELGHREDIAKIYDIKLDDPPYFLESEYTAGGNLHEWTEKRGGVGKLPFNQRLDLFEKVAEAVSAAHSIGVLHKDIKPANILIQENPDGSVFPRLSDFGIGILTEKERLSTYNLTASGFTQMTQQESSSGTPMYSPPESTVNKTFTMQGDVYALGVLMYQMTIGDFSKPLATGWEREVGDELLREDIASMVEGDLSRRLSSATEVVQRIKNIEKRREDRRRQRELEAGLKRRKHTIRVVAIALIILVVLLLLGAGGTAIYVRDLKAEKAKTLAEKSAAEDVGNFLIGMLREADPENSLGRQVTVIDLVQQAAGKIETAFHESRPLVKGKLQNVLADVSLKLGNRSTASVLYKSAMEIFARELGENDPQTLETTSNYTRTLESVDERVKIAFIVKQEAEKALGENHRVTLLSMYNYAMALRSQNRLPEAEEVMKVTLDRRRKLFGVTNLDTLAAVNYYAWILRLMDRNVEALGLCEEAYRVSVQMYGKDHPTTLGSLSNYAGAMLSTGNAKGARKLSEEAFEGTRKIFGEDHARTCYALSTYASVLAALECDTEAEKCFRDSIERAERNPNLGKRHSMTRMLVETHAKFLETRSRFDEAAAIRETYNSAKDQ